MPLAQTPCESKILAAVLQLGLGGETLSLDAEFRGGQCRVYKLSFLEDSRSDTRTTLAVRIPLYMSRNIETIDVLKTEWKVLETLQSKGFSWSPRPLGCSFTFDNPLEYPFLVLTWGDGVTLRWDDSSPPRPSRDKFLAQLATIQKALVRCTLETGMSTYRH
jgi:aminoglycoside phosphotransferase (APT) family kinase protein